MSRSIKFTNDTYLDSSGVTFEKTPFNKILTYSTEEVIIGKWIDGKFIYRKVINNLCGNLYGLLNNLNIDFLIDVKGNAWSNYNHKMPINTPNPEPPNYVFGVYQTASNRNIEVFYNSKYFADQNKVICIVEYTKTVD